MQFFGTNRSFRAVRAIAARQRASLLGVWSPTRPAGATLAFPLSDDGGAAFGFTITPVLVLLSDLVAAAPAGDCP
jgi:hypothetical protein